ncbi:MAG: DNA gyrase subunit A [Planctomycetales bacterium]|nr:DNA gyrase subunit A [Planctomycetales bacterium]
MSSSDLPSPSAPAPQIRDLSLEEEMKASYLTYAMSVIVSRALPDVRDGLKPSQRRILVAMNDLGLSPRAKFRKCAKICGDTTGNYHPHGDQVVYPTLVRFAQDFVMRYRLVEGQGNFGTVDGDPPAAMRYTEARLAAPAMDLLEDLDLDTVDMVPNYDERLKEPTVLPSKFPNLLCNGSSGIAVGMATSIPPHNAREIAEAIVAVVKNPDITADELMKIVPGPDFPTGGLLCGSAGIREAYTTGRALLRVRSRTHVEESRGRTAIVVTEIPYQVNRTNIIDRIAELVKEDRLRGVHDIRDESDREGSRLVIELKKDEDPEVIRNQLFKNTPLEESVSVNMIALVEGRPVTLTLKGFLEQFILHRKTVIVRRTKHLLAKAEAEAHVLEGLRIAVQAIDEVVAIIKKAADPKSAGAALRARFSLTEAQSDAILAMRLSRLTGLEVEKIESELAELRKKIAGYRELLGSEQKVKELVVAEARDLQQRFGDPRRTDIVAEAEELSAEDLIADEDVVVTISAEGYVKRMPMAAYRRQRRGGKGVTGADTKTGDVLSHVFVASTHDYLLFFTDRGRVYWQKVYDIPDLSRYSRGRAIVNLVNMRPEEQVAAMIPVRVFDDRYVLLVTAKGTIKKTVLSAFGNPRAGGIIAQTLDDDDRVVGAVVTSGEDEVLLGTGDGMGLRFREQDARPMGRTAGGVKGISLREGDQVVGMCLAEAGRTVLTVCEKGYGKRTLFEMYRRQRRGGIGLINIRVTDKNGKVVALRNVRDGDEILLVTTGGMVVRTPVAPISVIGRATQGVRLITLDEGDRLASVALVASEEGEPERAGEAKPPTGPVGEVAAPPGEEGDEPEGGDAGSGDGAGGKPA